MAADSRMTWGNIHSITHKIFRVRKAIVGCAGSDENGRIFVDWYARGALRNDKPEFDTGEDGADDFVALVLDRSGIYWFSDKLIPIPTEDKWAIGSGQDVALAALRYGMTPKEAVEFAMLVDSGTGPPVVVEKLN